jgi:hypothetical protein
MVGSCRLCGAVGALKRSHIIPDFYIRGLEHQLVTGEHGTAQPHSILLTNRSELEGGVKQRGFWEKILGMKEYLLCGTCEQKFQTNETYVRELLYGTSPPPLIKSTIGTVVADFTGQPDFDGLLLARKAVVDYKKLKLFQLSLLWRAGVAKGSFFEIVRLGEFHEAKLKNLLTAETPGAETDYACIMIDLRLNGKGCEGWIETPRRSKEGHQATYQFIIGGYMFLFTVSKQRPSQAAQLCYVKHSGEIIIVVADSTKILRSHGIVLRRLGRI